MKTLVIIGWKIGFNPVAFTKVLRTEFGISLREAKQLSEDIRHGKNVYLYFDDLHQSGNEKISLIKNTGVICNIP